MSPGEIVFFGVAIMPLIAGLVQVMKTAGFPPRYAGLLAVFFGVAAGALAAISTETNIAPGVAQGLLAGLGAAGVWSTAVAVKNGAHSEPANTGKSRWKKGKNEQ